MKRKKIFIIIGLILLFLYAVKNQFHINIFDSISLSNYFPFSLLQNNEPKIVHKNEFGIILEDSFESVLSKMNWQNLWMRKEGMVIQQYDSNGIDNSQCLLINNYDEGDWTYSHKDLIEVNIGDIFEFSGFIKKNNLNSNPAISIVTYNKNIEAVKWGYIQESINESNKWIRVQKTFKIPENVFYIRIYLYGNGKGTTWFDNIKFYR